MIQEILQAFILIFIAEMGDKTQILAMAFATKYPVRKVLVGIMIGSFLNHGLAVALGSQLTRIIPINTIQIIAGVAFLIFAFWSLKADEEEAEENKEVKYGAVMTVAIAFFIGELGDKTQLAAITIASSATSPMMVLIGTVSGMVATGSLGIFVGKKIGDKVPEFLIKAVASIIFLLFGTQKLYANVSTTYLTVTNIAIYLFIIIVPFVYLINLRYQAYRSGIKTRFEIKSRELHEYYKLMQQELETLCLGRENCGPCEGQKCPVGQSKAIINEAQKSEGIKPNQVQEIEEGYKKKNFDKETAKRIINATKKIDVKSEVDKARIEKMKENMKLIKDKPEE